MQKGDPTVLHKSARDTQEKRTIWGAKLPESKWWELAKDTLTTCEQEHDRFTKFRLTRVPAGAEDGAVSPFPALGCVESKDVAQGMGQR